MMRVISGALALLFALAIEAGATQPITAISGGGTIALTPAHDGQALIVDASAGQTVLTIDDVSALPAGFHVPIVYKADPGSNPVGFRMAKPGDTLNHFWNASSPYPLWLNMTQQAVELICDGVSACFAMGKSYHHNVGQSQRTFTTTFHQIRPQDVNEEIQVNAASIAGMTIAFDPVQNFSPPSPITGGNYHSHWVRLRRVDSSTINVYVYAAYGQCINDKCNTAPNQQFLLLNGYNATLTCYLTAAQIWCAP